jgi:hypothetical protein
VNETRAFETVISLALSTTIGVASPPRAAINQAASAIPTHPARRTPPPSIDHRKQFEFIDRHFLFSLPREFSRSQTQLTPQPRANFRYGAS